MRTVDALHCSTPYTHGAAAHDTFTGLSCGHAIILSLLCLAQCLRTFLRNTALLNPNLPAAQLVI